MRATDVMLLATPIVPACLPGEAEVMTGLAATASRLSLGLDALALFVCRLWEGAVRSINAPALSTVNGHAGVHGAALHALLEQMQGADAADEEFSAFIERHLAAADGGPPSQLLLDVMPIIASRLRCGRLLSVHARLLH